MASRRRQIMQQELSQQLWIPITGFTFAIAQCEADVRKAHLSALTASPTCLQHPTTMGSQKRVPECQMPNTMMPANLTCFSETFAKPSKLADEEMASRVLIRRFRFITRTSSRPVIGRAKTSSRTKPGGANFMAERQSCQAAGVFDS
ncbi:hypothetical protein TWF106_005969 [Orbilia oligospora]|uniref:Uncharacterized protein n=1 Tax=Orbilia oligospora TaxID=2813651 RepID=A0A6G1MF79_ORBOL|nr:hypothetical protein TWF788_006811 [Orbilia oligospora]KAF3205918.1 hypothetical protein TWF679_009099 [Orbilia oligospora]KAF3221683.1 hypothetical protein TWF106_005969 [Orbilia oligospora]KAF3225543.1 hypothetical protein TWF191_005246 [Orbilia oligospora]KAF3255366.1 hypothetical protein TWF192_002721 [Orbilia oligospora]